MVVFCVFELCWITVLTSIFFFWITADVFFYFLFFISMANVFLQ